MMGDKMMGDKIMWNKIMGHKIIHELAPLAFTEVAR